MSNPGGKPHPLAFLGSIAGAGIGYYAGLHLLIPAFSGLVVGFAATRLLPESRKPFVPAIGVLSGHAIWMVVALILIGGYNPIVIDIGCFCGLVAWLALVPGIAAAVAVTGFEVVSLALNVSTFVGLEAGSTQHKAMVVHLGLRVLGIVFVWTGVFRARSGIGSLSASRELVALLRSLLHTLEAPTAGVASAPLTASLKPLVGELEGAVAGRGSIEAVNAVLADIDPLIEKLGQSASSAHAAVIRRYAELRMAASGRGPSTGA
jgi:hypothetical protein